MQEALGVRVLAAAAITLALSALAVACGGGDGDSPKHTTVAVTLSEWEITAEPSMAGAGDMTFELSNAGEVAHNLVIAKSDLPPGELPTADDSVDTSKLNIAGTAGPIAPGPAPEGDDGYGLSLSPGKYVLFCDVVIREGGSLESHYRNGMYTSFLVEP